MAVAGSHIKMIGILIHLFHNRMQENTAVLRTDFSGAVIKDPPFRERDSFLFRKSNDITAHGNVRILHGYADAERFQRGTS